MTKLKPNLSQSQAGVTLLLSILVLAAITAIAFSLSAIILVEIRSSGDVTRTEPALYAAQAVTEEGLFKYQRGVSDSALNLSTLSFNVGTSGTVGLTTQLKNYDPAPRIDTIPVGTTAHYLFIDPTRPSDLNTKVYDSFSFKALNSVSGAAASVTKCCDQAGNSLAVSPSYPSLQVNNTYPVTISDNKQYDLAITNTNPTTPLLVEIDAIKTSPVAGLCSSPCHLIPLLGKALSIKSSYLGLTRQYSVAIKTQGPQTVPQGNVALASNGATAAASSTYPGYAASGAINGDRKGLNYGADGYWSTLSAGFPAWLQVDFGSSKTISEIDVFTVQDNYTNPVEPTSTTTFTLYGLSGYSVQYWNGSTWVTVTGGTVSGNNRIWRSFTFTPVTTSRIRVLTSSAPDNYSRLTEVEAWGN